MSPALESSTASASKHFLVLQAKHIIPLIVTFFHIHISFNLMQVLCFIEDHNIIR